MILAFKIAGTALCVLAPAWLGTNIYDQTWPRRTCPRLLSAIFLASLCVALFSGLLGLVLFIWS